MFSFQGISGAHFEPNRVDIAEEFLWKNATVATGMRQMKYKKPSGV